MGELKQMQDAAYLAKPGRVAELEAENKTLQAQLLQVQRAYLMQQRELNVLQMERIDAAEAAAKT